MQEHNIGASAKRARSSSTMLLRGVEQNNETVRLSKKETYDGPVRSKRRIFLVINTNVQFFDAKDRSYSPPISQEV